MESIHFRRTRWLSLLLVLSGAFLQPSHAGSEPKGTHEEAVRQAREARRLYDQGEYRQAIAGFEKAYGIVGRASLLFNIADCYERLGEGAKAIAYYRRFLANCELAERPQARKLIAAIERRPSRLRVRTQPAGARVWLNDQPMEIETPIDITVPPGEVTIRLEKQGHRPHRETLTARYGDPLHLVVTLPQLDPSPAARPRAQETEHPGPAPVPRLRTGGFVGLSGGLQKPRWQGVDQPRINYSMSLFGGLGLTLGGRLRLELGGRCFLTSINDESVLVLLDISALFGVRVQLWRRLHAFLRAGLGVATLHGARWHSFFFDGAHQATDTVPSSYGTFAAWGALGLGYRLWRGLHLELTLAGLDYVLPLGYLRKDAPALEYIFRYNLHFGLQVDL